MDPSKPENPKLPDIASASVPDMLAALHVNPDTGLTQSEVDASRKEHGYNEVAETKGHPVLKFLGKFWGISAWMLELIMVLSAVLRKFSDLAVVGALLAVNAVLSFMQEHRAAGVVEALRKRLQVSARVLRESNWRVIPARGLPRNSTPLLNSAVRYPIDSIETLDHTYVVGDNNHRCFFLPAQLAEETHDDLAALRVQRSRRFVGQQDRRVVRKCTSNCNSLLLTARDLARIVVPAMGDLKVVEQFHGSLLCFLPANLIEHENQLYIFENCEERDQVVGLEDHAHFLPAQRTYVDAGPAIVVHQRAIKFDPTPAGLVNATDRSQ